MSAERAVIAAYVRIADSDLRSARVLARNGLRNAWYELEQAAEKLIRAVLTSEGIRGGIHHRLDQMVDLIPDENPLKPAMRSVQELAAYATTFRYPTDGGRIVTPRGDIHAWIGKVQLLFDESATRFGVDVASRDTPATNGGPLR